MCEREGKKKVGEGMVGRVKGIEFTREIESPLEDGSRHSNHDTSFLKRCVEENASEWCVCAF